MRAKSIAESTGGRGWSDKTFGLTGVLFPSGFIALVRAGTRAERNKNATTGEGDGGCTDGSKPGEPRVAVELHNLDLKRGHRVYKLMST